VYIYFRLFRISDFDGLDSNCAGKRSSHSRLGFGGSKRPRYLQHRIALLPLATRHDCLSEGDPHGSLRTGSFANEVVNNLHCGQPGVVLHAPTLDISWDSKMYFQAAKKQEEEEEEIAARARKKEGKSSQARGDRGGGGSGGGMEGAEQQETDDDDDHGMLL